jgi:hypothetical protein
MAANQTLNDFFAGPVMSRLMNSESIKRGLPFFLPPATNEYSSERPVGMQVMWDEVAGNRQLAQLVTHTAPSRRAELPGVTKRFATALGAKEHFVIDVDMLLALKSDVPMVQEAAKRRIVQMMADFRSRFDNLRISLINSVFSKGAIWADKSGNVLPSSSGAQVTVSFGVNSFNKNSTYLGGGTVGDWSSAGTDIFGSLRALGDDSVQRTNYTAKHIMYGSSIPGYLVNNTGLQAYLARNPLWSQQILTTNEVPDGFLDYTWHKAYSSYFIDQNGQSQKWWAPNQITVCPEITPDWYEFVPAGTLIPNGIAAPGASLDECLTAAQVVNGYFAYCEAMGVDPMQVKVHNGWYGLPVVKVPGVLYEMTVS